MCGHCAQYTAVLTFICKVKFSVRMAGEQGEVEAESNSTNSVNFTAEALGVCPGKGYQITWHLLHERGRGRGRGLTCWLLGPLQPSAWFSHRDQ